MTLNKNQVVVFPNGERQGWLEARWSERHQAFYTFIESDDEDARNGLKKIFSTVIEEKPVRKSSKKFVPTAKNCPVLLDVCGETEKAYRVCTGTNGCVTRGNLRYYYKFVAKSICYVDENGKVFSPTWA